MLIDSAFIAKTLKQAQLLGDKFSPQASFSVDSRTLQRGDVFVAVKGEKCDGHDFIEQALEKEVSGFILSDQQKDLLLKKYQKQFEGKTILFVASPVQALIDIAHAWRMQFNYPVVAITGSVGKTTTKEMVKNILKLTDLKYIVSTGNQNTLIGVSMNILKMRPEHQAAVFELGISEKGCMKQLAELLRPTYALITKIGYSHMQGLGDRNTISQEKRDIFACFTSHDIGVINGDQAELAQVSYMHPVIRFGKKTTNQIQARKIICQNNTISFIVKIYNNRYPVVLQTCHESRVINALGAIAIGHLLRIPDQILIQGVEQPVTVSGRFQILEQQSGSIIIHDGYNSNPDSAKASLIAFDQYKTNKKKIIVLGDMLELGGQTPFWHRQLGRFLCKVSNIDQVVLVGNHVKWTQKTISLRVKSHLFANIDEAYNLLKDIVAKEDNVLLFKASNSIKFSELIARLQEIGN